MSQLSQSAQVRIDSDRLLGRLHALAQIGRDPRGGLTRPGFSPADRRAGRLLRNFATRGGLQATVDAGGNILIRRSAGPSGRPTLLVGSHLDTVVSGGWLDGSYGVIAALEVLQAVSESDVDLGVDLVAVAFANEEGALFPQPFFGSMVLSGMLDALPDDPVDTAGNPLAPALAAAGGAWEDLESAVRLPGSLLGYLELHIEQGPVLESAGLQIGIVDAIVGRSIWEIDIAGTPGHAGTTPMTNRRDALLGAARLALVVDKLPRRPGSCTVATTGRIEVYPNSPNTIAGTARLTVDLRDCDPARLTTAEHELQREITQLARRHDLDIVCRRTVRSEPAATDAGLRAAIEASAEELRLPYTTMSSGAGHDAQIVASITPIGMLFAPSIGGVSHVPQEDTSAPDLVAGVRALAATVLRVASR